MLACKIWKSLVVLFRMAVVYKQARTRRYDRLSFLLTYCKVTTHISIPQSYENRKVRRKRGGEQIAQRPKPKAKMQVTFTAFAKVFIYN